MTLETWLLFVLTETVLCLSPGPSVLLVVSHGLTHGRRTAVQAGVGVLAANAMYFTISAAGISALLLASHELFLVVKWLGAGYLLYIGSRMLFPRRAAPRPDAAALQASPRPRRGFRDGFITQGANANLLVYFSAILPQFVNPDAAMAPQVALLALTSICIEFTVLVVYASAASYAARAASSPRYVPALERAGGALLIAAGLGLARLRRATP